jgi:hypothetical protein
MGASGIGVQNSMSGRQATMVAILSLILAACSAGADSTPSGRPTSSSSHGPSTPARMSPSPTTVTPSPTLVATPPPTPTPTPRSTPAKPSGVGYGRCCGEGNTEPVSSVSWKKPRATGVEIRVYGIPVCLPREDGGDEWCLRQGTELPADKVLLAKAPASKGVVSWYQDEDEDETDLCSAAMVDKNGTHYYSVVVGAYGANGHSVFAIADEGWYDSEECAAYVVQKGDSLAAIAGRYGLTVDDLIAANLSTLPDPNKLRVGSTILIPSSWLVEARS